MNNIYRNSFELNSKFVNREKYTEIIEVEI